MSGWQKHIVFFFILICPGLHGIRSYAQDKPAADRIVLLTDRKSYVTGEQVWCNTLVLPGIPGHVNHADKIMYASLVDASGRPVLQVKWAMENGQASGYMLLPSTLVSGIYVLRAETKGDWISGATPILVVNPARPPLGGKEAEEINPAKRNFKTPEHLTVVPDKNEYGTRKRISIELSAAGQVVSPYTVSVHRLDPLETFADSLLSGIVIPDMESGPESQHAAWEFEGHLIGARVFPASDTTPAANIRVYVSVIGQEARIASAVSGQDGYLGFILPMMYSESQLAFTAWPGGTGYRLELLPDPGSGAMAARLPALPLKGYLAEAIRERYIEAQVFQKFLSENTFRYLLQDADTTDFYGVPDKRYQLDDYTRFPNMEEIITEFVTEVKLKKNRDNAELLVLNAPYKKFFDEPALVLIDGVPVTDMKKFLSLDPLQLKSIDVVARKFYMGDISFSGIIHYKSYKGDLGGYALPAETSVYPYDGVQLSREFLSPEYKTTSDIRIPDFRNLLYWSSSALPGKTGRASVEFFSGDIPGIYQIRVYALGSDGQLMTGSREIEIK